MRGGSGPQFGKTVMIGIEMLIYRMGYLRMTSKSDEVNYQSLIQMKIELKYLLVIYL